MNALSIQDDITFDITNTKMIILRIVLGGLLGSLICFPFSYDAFLNFCKAIWNPAIFVQTRDDALRQASLLIFPFVLGFSTSLVILILSRLVESLSVIFGYQKERLSAQRSSR